MAKQQKNMFGSFGVAAEERQQEQQQIEAAVMGKAQVQTKSAVGRPRKRQDATQITLIISAADKAKVKKYAFDHAVTVSDLLHRWIEENCTED